MTHRAQDAQARTTERAEAVAWATFAASKIRPT